MGYAPPPGSPSPPSPTGYYAPPPGYAAPPGPPPGAYAAPPPPHEGHHRLFTVVGVVVVLVVLLLVLSLSGILSFPFLPGGSKSGTNPGATALTFHQAETQGNATAAGRGSGSWGLVYAYGFETPEPVNFASQIPCGGFEGFNGGGDFGGQGAFTGWELGYLSEPIGVYSHLLLMSVYNGSASLNVQVDPQSACPGYGGGDPFPQIAFPLNVSDSPWAVASAGAHGGAAFLAGHPNATVELELYTDEVGFPARADAEWFLSYDTACSGTSFGTSSSFTATMNATNATVLSHSWGNVTCSITAPAPHASLTLGAAASGQSGTGATATFYENLTVQATRGLSTGNFSVAILGANRTLVNPTAIPCFPPGGSMTGCGQASVDGGWYAEVLSSGAVEGAFPFTADILEWLTLNDKSVSLASGASIEIVSATSLSGDTLVAYSSNSAAWATTTLA